MGAFLSVLRTWASRSPKTLAIVLACLVVARQRLRHALPRIIRPEVDETFADTIGRFLLHYIPAVRKEYRSKINEQVSSMRPARRTNIEEFGAIRTSIPEIGWSQAALKSEVDRISLETKRRCETSYLSGTIYPYTYWKDGTTDTGSIIKHGHGNGNLPEYDFAELKHPRDFASLNAKLEDIFTYGFRESYLWNPLHASEFGVGEWLNYQVIRMVADMYGGKPKEVMGLMTTGGTESLMTAMRSYKRWGIENRNHGVGEGVILCLHSVHAAINKACEAFDLGIVQVPCDKDDNVDLKEFRRIAHKLRDKLVCIVGSAPSYPIGTIDPIHEMAAIAQEVGVGMHVDCCLGGFIVNFLDESEVGDTNFLAIPGVTSLSCDTHKNGWAPKGSSVLVTKELPDLVLRKVNLIYFNFYSTPGWSGGLYGTPSTPGSLSSTTVLHAYLALLAIGKQGYRRLAETVSAASAKVAGIIDKFPQLERIGKSKVNVVGWRLSPKSGLEEGAIYALAHELSHHSITVSICGGRRLHFCITPRSAADPSFFRTFEQAMQDSLSVVEEMNARVQRGEDSFPGDAGIYGSIEAALAPTEHNTTSKVELAINKVLGTRGAKDGVKAYWYSVLDPFSSSSF